MNQKLHERLREVARRCGIIDYGEAALVAGLDMTRPGHQARMKALLDRISRHEHGQGRPLLSAVVVHMEKNVPGNEFFALAAELGLFRGTNRLAFFVNELRRVHDYWAYP